MTIYYRNRQIEPAVYVIEISSEVKTLINLPPPPPPHHTPSRLSGTGRWNSLPEYFKFYVLMKGKRFWEYNPDPVFPPWVLYDRGSTYCQILVVFYIYLFIRTTEFLLRPKRDQMTFFVICIWISCVCYRIIIDKLYRFFLQSGQFGVKKVLAPSKNPSKSAIMCFALQCVFITRWKISM
jgi:hypothetical protein